MKKLYVLFLSLIICFCIVITNNAYAETRAYVTNVLDDSVSVIRTSYSTVIATVNVGDQPHGVAVAPNGNYVYVANEGDDTVSVIRTSDNTVTATINVGDFPYGVAVAPNGNYVYVANEGDDTVSVIRTSDNTVTATINVGDRPIGVDVTPDGNYVYVANLADDSISVIKTSDNSVSSLVNLDFGNNPAGIAVTPDGNFVYVTGPDRDQVYVVRTSDNTKISTINVGDKPVFPAITPDGNYVYVANEGDDTVSVIRTSYNTVTTTINVGNYPCGVAVTPNGDYVYVPNANDDTVSVIRTSDNAVTTTIKVGDYPSSFGKFIGSVSAPESPSNLTASAQSSSQIDLSWTDNSSDETGFKIERKTGASGTYSEIATVSADVTTYGDTGCNGATTYYYRVRAYNASGNSSYSSEASATTSSSGGGCFIATAAYGSPMEQHVKVLSQFRDHFLLTNLVGRAFVDLYYTYSPTVAEFTANHDTLRAVVRWSLLPLVGLSWVALKLGSAVTLPLIVLLFALMSAIAVITMRHIRLRRQA